MLEKIYEEKINRNNDLLFDLSFTENKEDNSTSNKTFGLGVKFNLINNDKEKEIWFWRR